MPWSELEQKLAGGSAGDRLPAEAKFSKDTEVYRYPGAGHAFDNPMPAFHHVEASALAWQRTTEFLSRHLPPSEDHA